MRSTSGQSSALNLIIYKIFAISNLSSYVLFSVECFCGNSEPSSSLEIPLTECNMKCPESLSNNAQFKLKFCGGYFAINVFETGVLLGNIFL